MSQPKQLNQTLTGCPSWPYITAFEEEKKITVHGDHIDLGVYSAMRKLVVFLIVLGLPVACYRAIHSSTLPEMGLTIVGYFCAYIPLLFVPQWPHIIGMRLFPSRTNVRFTPKGISIGRKTYPFDPRVAIAFRASRSPMHPNRFRQQSRKAQADTSNADEAYELEFRFVEMIYGARVIKITNLADEHRAGQFALALQKASELAQTDSWNGEMPQMHMRHVLRVSFD